MPLQAGLLRVRLQVCGKNTPDRGEGSGPSRDQFPPSVLRACSLLRAGGNNTPQPANFICCHFLIFSLSLSLKHNSAPHWLPTVHHCTPVKPRLVAVGSPRFQSCRRCLECFSLSLYFSSVMFWEQKIHQTSWFFLLLRVACGLQQFQVGSGEERASRKRQKHGDRLHLKDANTLRMQQMELEISILSFKVC